MTGERLERLCFVTASDVCGQEIILYCERTGRMGALLAACRQQRPTVAWPSKL